jgi:hypothetical protein
MLGTMFFFRSKLSSKALAHKVCFYSPKSLVNASVSPIIFSTHLSKGPIRKRQCAPPQTKSLRVFDETHTSHTIPFTCSRRRSPMEPFIVDVTLECDSCFEKFQTCKEASDHHNRCPDRTTAAAPSDDVLKSIDWNLSADANGQAPPPGSVRQPGFQFEFDGPDPSTPVVKFQRIVGAVCTRGDGF